MEPAALIYVVDPMCSWCWGFAPAFAAVRDHHRDLDVHVVAGGLRPGESAQPLNDSMRSFLSHHWEKVAEVTGQPFDQAGLDRDGWVYDTETADIALVTMRSLNPERIVEWVHHLHEAFYAKAIDVTDPDVYPDLVSGFDVDVDAFMLALASDEMRSATWKDFGLARQLGASGFPTVLGLRDGQAVTLTQGYVNAEQFDSLVHQWIEMTAPQIAPGAACSIDGVC